MQPSFLCIGFQKCGTTTLFDLLEQHRGVALPRDVKEPMYYRTPAILRPGGNRYYQWRYFSHISPDDKRLVGEVNAGLSYCHCAQRLKENFSPETKLIFMMRNPVDRAWSAYKFFVALGFLPISVTRDDLRLGHAVAFDQYVRRVLGDSRQRNKIMKRRLKYLVFSQGNYDTCIGEFDDYFPNKKYILFEEFVRDQKGVCEDVYRFLEIEPDEDIQYGIKANETHRAAAGPLRARARNVAKAVDYFFDEFIGMRCWAPSVYGAYHRFNRFMYRTCTVEDTDRSKMLPETRKLLEDYYRDEKERLEARMHRDLSDIWF
ncbi:MAG: sulfotransferase domain-containing protein [Clostridiales bacterium]|nr:sulfotransferase domain-containing protein [Clostridiales bacterium]